MQLKPSFSYPEILVAECGTLYLRDTGDRLYHQTNHGTSAKGPVAHHKVNGKVRQIPVRTLVYEAWIKNDKVAKGEYIESRDGDDMNVRASNLYRAKARFDVETKASSRDREGHSCWMNGIDEAYML